jgi:aldehyde:ferredoxin oxidoreductase
MLAHEYKKYACWRCNIACGGHYRTDDPTYPVTKTHKPEYETSALWDNNLLNDNIHSLMKADDLCNRYGLDTSSTGSVVGFAIECYERGLLSKAGDDGLELTWGTPPRSWCSPRRSVSAKGSALSWPTA